MTESHADAIVLFGATGDLAFKKIFPALQAMIKRGHLTVPVIGVAKANRHVADLRDRVRESLNQFGGGVDEAACQAYELLRFVDLHEERVEVVARLRGGELQEPVERVERQPAHEPRERAPVVAARARGQ